LRDEKISMKGVDGLRKNDGIFVAKMPSWLRFS
jgi:hypothetical protein